MQFHSNHVEKMRHIINIIKCKSYISCFLTMITMFLWICGVVIENVVWVFVRNLHFTPRNMRTVRALMYLFVVWQWSISPIPFTDSGASGSGAAFQNMGLMWKGGIYFGCRCSVPSDYLNQRWRIVNWGLVNKCDWNWIQIQFAYTKRNLKISPANGCHFVSTSMYWIIATSPELCGIDGKPLRTALCHCRWCLYCNECHIAHLGVIHTRFVVIKRMTIKFHLLRLVG